MQRGGARRSNGIDCWVLSIGEDLKVIGKSGKVLSVSRGTPGQQHHDMTFLPHLELADVVQLTTGICHCGVIVTVRVLVVRSDNMGQDRLFPPPQ
jgi:hypothetical protein